MSSAFAASITVLPGATSTFLPSISRFSIDACPPGRPKGTPAPWGETSEANCGGMSSASDVVRHQAALVIDVVLEFVPEMVDEALHGQRRGVAQRADRAPGDVVGDRNQEVEVFVTALAVLDSVDDAPEPPGPLAARRALAAGFLEIEIRQ